MRRWLPWIIGAGALLALLVLAYVVIQMEYGEQR
jgi:hypothetical protein